MIKAEQYYKNKDNTHFHEVMLRASSQNLNGWEEYYWTGLYLNEYAPDGTYNQLIVDTLEESFFEGLSYLTNRDCYLNVVKVLGRLYLELQQYDYALNMLQMLVLKDPNVPEWVYLRFAYAQMHSDTAKRLVDEPKYLYEKLDCVNSANINMVEQRNAIFQDYLELCVEFHDMTEIEIDTDTIFEKAAEYGVLHSDSWKKFASGFPQIFGYNSVINELGNIEQREEVIVDVVEVYEHLSQESKNRIYIFFDELVKNYNEALVDEKRIQGLASDILSNFNKEKNIIRLAALEGGVSIMARAINGTDINQRMAFSNASKILVDRCGFGKAVAIDVVIEMARAMNYSISLDDFEEDSDEAISTFSDRLVNDLEQENTELMDKIHNLQEQMKELINQNQNFEHLLEEKQAFIEQLTINEECIDNIAKSVANGVSKGHDLLEGNKKILVIGQSVVSIDKLLGIVKNYGYEKSDFIFWNDYEKITSYAERMAGGSFSGIIAGPMPHKVTKLGDYSSLIEKMKQPGYPYLEEARSESGELKISKNSFRKALEGMTKHLLAIQ